ncbi:Aegerolysin [Beauveria brongniartii RCEF 3172]|uniref:Aegerolysin n=1 Tax=Beauveria brongniartii RCEF 3172 TaxID=1081107 RepID=A0A167D5C5_9HYPO|nr:Aegerolysin [Beauveria brongniartii RCEF 3172]
MAYAQWVSITIVNLVKSGIISVQDAYVVWGKFYERDNKDNEIQPSKVNNITVAPGAKATVAATGRSDASSGAEGGFNLHLGGQKICGVYFDCPWGDKSNDLQIRDYNPATSPYHISTSDINRDSGALGNVTLTVMLR